MSDQTPPVDEMQYERLANEALRGVMRAALDRVLTEGLPGAHHFYITFKTRAVGVSVAPDILAKYPEEMTVVLQHQYDDLRVEPERFSVKLRFGGMPKSLVIPYSAVTRFYDPSVQFLLQFESATSNTTTLPVAQDEPAEPPAETDPDAPNVVSLDTFRKK